MTREAARQYPERWRLVEDREISELRKTPIESKAKQRCEFVSAATTVQGSATRIVSTHQRMQVPQPDCRRPYLVYQALINVLGNQFAAARLISYREGLMTASR
jgi:hypothetical protein